MNKTISIIGLLLILLCSCRDEAPKLANPILPEDVPSQNFILPQEACAKLKNAWPTLPKSNPTTRSSENPPMDSIYTVPGNSFIGVIDPNGDIWGHNGEVLDLENIQFIDTVNTYAYAVTFAESQGFVVVAAKENLPDILFYTENGSYCESINNTHTGMNVLMDMMDKWVHLQTSADESDPNLYGGYTNPGNWRTTKKQAYEGIGTKWSQKEPYNIYCPYHYIYQCHYVTGCAATALAQIMAFYQYPASYDGYNFNWHNTLWNGDNEPVAKLMYFLGLPENLDMQYKSDYEGGYGIPQGILYSEADPQNIPRTFQRFGYKNTGTRKDYNFNLLKKEIDADRPILLLGTDNSKQEIESHIWVCDKYLIREREVYNDKGDYKTERHQYVYCNWGFGGQYDGYALSKIFDTSQTTPDFSPKNRNIKTQKSDKTSTSETGVNWSANYSTNAQMYINILPK